MRNWLQNGYKLSASRGQGGDEVGGVECADPQELLEGLPGGR